MVGHENTFRSFDWHDREILPNTLWASKSFLRYAAAGKKGMDYGMR